MFDVLTETLSAMVKFYLLVQRTTWLYPIRLNSGNQAYINITYQQTLPTYIDGYYIETQRNVLEKQTQVTFAFFVSIGC